MISVTIWRKTLVRYGACASGLVLFDTIASMQPESDPRRLRRIHIPRWGALHWIMLAQAGYSGWLVTRGIVPRVNLRDANLVGVDLTGVDFTSVDLRGVDLRGANLTRAHLRGAHLAGADLYGANLTRVNLHGANLYGANLVGVDLTGAHLTGANLADTHLTGADFTGAYRGHGQPPIPGWRTDADGYLEREGVTRG